MTRRVCADHLVMETIQRHRADEQDGGIHGEYFAGDAAGQSQCCGRTGTELVQHDCTRQIRFMSKRRPTCSPLWADPIQIQQAVISLLTNAMESFGRGDGEIYVSTYHRVFSSAALRRSAVEGELPAGRYVCLSIRDTGSGMDEHTLARVFEAVLLNSLYRLTGSACRPCSVFCAAITAPFCSTAHQTKAPASRHPAAGDGVEQLATPPRQ